MPTYALGLTCSGGRSLREGRVGGRGGVLIRRPALCAARCWRCAIAAGSSRAARGAADPDPGVLLAFAYPDRIGRRRPGAENRYTLANGRGAHFAEAQSLARQELIVALDLDDRERDARILLAAPVERAD